MPEAILSTRANKGGSLSSEPGPIRFLKVPGKKSPAFWKSHNVTQADLNKRHRSIRNGLDKAGYKGDSLTLEWPAKVNAANYLEDRRDAHQVCLQLVDDCITTFAALVKKACPINLSSP